MTHLNKLKKIKIISSILSDHNSRKLEINYRKKNEKRTNMWRLKIILLRDQWVNEEIKKEIRKYLNTNENGNATLQSLWDIEKAALRGKIIAIQAFVRKQEKYQINNLTDHLKELEKEQTKPEVSKRKEIIKIREETNTIEFFKK